MGTKRLLRDRIMSLVLACVMLFGMFVTDGFIIQAKAENTVMVDNVKDRLDVVSIRGPNRVDEEYMYNITIDMEFVGNNNNVIKMSDLPGASAANFTVKYTSRLDAEIINANKVITADKKLDNLIFSGLFTDAELKALCEAADNLNEPENFGYAQHLSDGAASGIYDAFLEHAAARFRKTITVQLLSVKNTGSGSTVHKNWESKSIQMSLTHKFRIDGNNATYDPNTGTQLTDCYKPWGDTGPDHDYVRIYAPHLENLVCGPSLDDNLPMTEPEDYTLCYYPNSETPRPYTECCSPTNITASGSWTLDGGLLVDLMAEYNVLYSSSGDYTIADRINNRGGQNMSKDMFDFSVLSYLFGNNALDESGNFKHRYPASNEDFVPMEGAEGWDGFLRYRAVISNPAKAYGAISSDYEQYARAALTNEGNRIDLETCQAFANKLNEESPRLYLNVVESMPGLFYRIDFHEEPGKNPKYDEDPSLLVKNISAHYDVAADEVIIDYDQRSTGNTVYFFFFPVVRRAGSNYGGPNYVASKDPNAAGSGNVIDTYFDLTAGNTRIRGDISKNMSITVSVMELPQQVRNALEAGEADGNGKAFRFDLHHRGNLTFAPTVKPNYERYNGYFRDINRYYVQADCIPGSEKISPNTSTNGSNPDSSGDSGCNSALPGPDPSTAYHSTDKAVMDALFAQDNASTPKLTISGTPMVGNTGYPHLTLSLESYYWDEGTPPPPIPSPEGDRTVILDWNMNGFSAMDLKQGTTPVAPVEIKSSSDGAFASTVYNNIDPGNSTIWFSRSADQAGMSLLIPGLDVGADIPYDTLKTFLQTQADGTIDNNIKVLTQAQYDAIGPIKNGYCHKINMPDMSGDKEETTLIAIYRGISTEASGGTIIAGTEDLNQTTPIPVPADFPEGSVGVLYAQWDFITMPGHVGSNDTSGGFGDLHTVVFDYNYYGGEAIAETVGKCDIKLSVNGASTTASIVIGLYDPLQYLRENWDQKSWSSIRPGWNFVGWSEDPIKAVAKLQAEQKFTGDDPDHGGYYYDDEIKEYAENPDRSATFYALWIPEKIDWNANGGYFASVWGAEPGKVTTRGDMNDTMAEARAQPPFASDLDKPTAYVRQTYTTPVPEPVQDYVCVQHGNRRNPLRTGYRFAGWYYDEWCVIPINEFETGIQPGRTYFAGWEPDPVYVRYYDTREGGGLIAEQEYKYGDKLVLPDNIKDTDGQKFSRWVVNVNGETRAATSVTDLINQEEYNPAERSMRFTDEVLTRYKRTNDGSDEPLTWYDVTMGIAHTSGSILNYDSYWVLNVYTEWDEKTADYTATIDWEDFDNNDGCRPTSVKVGLRSSLNDRTVEEVDITGSPTAKQWSHTFTDLPITTSDASVEEITYDIYMISFTDAKGNTHEIRDTGSTSGEITVATMSEADTAISSTYKYGINNYMTRGPESRNYAGKITMDYGLITTGTDIKFTLQWDDASNQDGKRPGAVRLVLLADGQPVQVDTDHNSNTGFVDVNPGMCEVSPDGNTWTYTFKNYQKYRDGKAIEYSVAVVNDGTGRYDYATNKFDANGYSTIYITDAGADSDPAGAILRRPVEKTSKTAYVMWDDESNRDGFRPDSVTVNLYAYQYNETIGEQEKVFIASKECTDGPTGPSWSVRFDDLDVNRNGQPVTYVAEIASELNVLIPESANKYEWTNQELTITVSRLPNTQGVTATVQWDDDNNNDGIRPQAVLLELYADGRPITEAFGIAEADWKVILSGDPTADEWSYYYEDLPVFAEGNSGRRIVYSLKVSEVESGSLYGTYEERGVLGAAHTFSRYTAAYPRKNTGTFAETFGESAQPTVRLTHYRNMIEVPVSIIWKDMNNRDGQRTDYVTLALTSYQWNRDTYRWEYMEVASQTVRTDDLNTMTGDEWTATFGLHDMYHDGEKVIYHLAVVSDLNEYLPEGSYEYGWVESAHGNQVDAIPQVTISQNLNIVSVLATVYWDDSQNNDAIRPKNVVLQLYVHAPGEKPVPVTGQAYRVNVTGDPTADNWYHTFSGMPKYAVGQSGVELIYTFRVLEANGEPCGESVYIGNAAYGVLQTLVVALSAGLDMWGQSTCWRDMAIVLGPSRRA